MADLIDRKELRDALYEADAVTMIKSRFPAKNSPTFSPMKPSRTSSAPTP